MFVSNKIKHINIKDIFTSYRIYKYNIKIILIFEIVEGLSLFLSNI